MSIESMGRGVMLKLRRWQVMRTAVALYFSVLCISLPAGNSSASALSAQQAPVNPHAQALVEFKKRVDAYLELRKAVTQKYPEVKETGDPAKIHTREVNLGKGIAMARANAKAGDIFAPVSRQLLKTVEDDWNSRSAADRKAILAEVPKGLALKVNQPYPPTIALATVPPKLLAQLPVLPEELEYRLVDRRLLLRDRDANLIVDVLVGAEPTRTE
jgi:hypothetical protein